MRDIPSAAERARWLAEVAQALDEAQLLVERIPPNQGQAGPWLELLHRIESARRATRTMRLASDRRIARPSHPE